MFPISVSHACDDDDDDNDDDGGEWLKARAEGPPLGPKGLQPPTGPRKRLV